MFQLKTNSKLNLLGLFTYSLLVIFTFAESAIAQSAGKLAAETLNLEKNRNFQEVQNPGSAFQGTKLGDSFFSSDQENSSIEAFSEVSGGVPHGATLIWDSKKDDLVGEAEFRSGIPSKILVYGNKADTPKLEMNFKDGALFELKTDSGQSIKNVSDIPEKVISNIQSQKIEVDPKDLRRFRDELKSESNEKYKSFEAVQSEMERLPSGVASQVFQELGLSPDTLPSSLANPQSLSSTELRKAKEANAVLSAKDFSGQLTEAVGNFLGSQVEASIEGNDLSANPSLDPGVFVRSPNSNGSDSNKGSRDFFESARLDP